MSTRLLSKTFHPIVLLVTALLAATLMLPSAPLLAAAAAPPADNPAPPASPVKLIFIHHSTGENWLADDNGGLGKPDRSPRACSGRDTTSTPARWMSRAAGETCQVFRGNGLFLEKFIHPQRKGYRLRRSAHFLC